MKKLLLLVLALIATLALAQQSGSDLWAGTWKLDMAQSQLHTPGLKDLTLTAQSAGPDGKTVKYSFHGTIDDGTTFDESYDGKADGKPYPFVSDGKEVAKVSYTRDSDHQYTSRSASADGGSGVGTIVLSNDGRTITIHQHMKTTSEEFEQVFIYHKQ